MLRVRIWSAIFTAITLALLASATSGAAKVNIVVWDAIPQSGQDAYKSVVADFRATHPDISVETQTMSGGYGEIIQKFTVAWAGGIAPNIVHISHTSTYTFRYTGIFMPLNDYIAKDPSFDLKDWYPPFIETVSIGDTIYGLPYNESTPVTYYNPDLLQESGLSGKAPTTWDEMRSFGKKVTRDYVNGVPSVWAMDFEKAPGWIQLAFLAQAGGSMLNADRTRLTLNSPEGVEAWEYMQSLVRDRIARYPGAPAAEIYGGKIGWYFRSVASLRSTLDQAAANNMRISVAALPCYKRCGMPIGGGAFYAANTGTKAQRDATYEFLKFISRPENQARFAVATGYMAARRKAVQTPELQQAFKENPEYMVTYQQLAYAFPETPSPEATQIHALWNNAKDFLEPMWVNFAPVKPLLDEVARRGNLLLDEFYAKYERK